MELHTNKFNCVHDNPYKTHCTLIPESLCNPTGRQLSILPFGINHEQVISRYYTDNTSTNMESVYKHHLYPNTTGKYMIPETLYPRPAIRIGYEYRNS